MLHWYHKKSIFQQSMIQKCIYILVQINRALIYLQIKKMMAKSKSKPKPGQRLVMQLDPRIALEAIILNRLERIPTVRRQEWLRGLLVLGFRSECQTLRGAIVEKAKSSSTIFKNWHVMGANKSAEPVVMDKSISAIKNDSKPFAQLGRVIG